MHHTERGRFVVGVRSAWQPVVSPITGGWELCEVSFPAGGTVRVGTESSSLHSLQYITQRESGAVRALVKEIVSVGIP